MDIYLLIEGQPQGPYTEDQVRQSLATRHITGDLAAWREGLADWEQVAHLLKNLPQTTAAPPIFVSTSTPLQLNKKEEGTKLQAESHSWYIKALLIAPAIGIGLMWLQGACPTQLLIAIPFLLGMAASTRYSVKSGAVKGTSSVSLWILRIFLCLLFLPIALLALWGLGGYLISLFEK